MKSKRLLNLQIVTAIALVVFALMLAHVWNGLLTTNPIAGPATAEQAIQSAKDIEELKVEFRSHVKSLSSFLKKKNVLLLESCGANLVMVGFLGLSLFMIGRIKNEVASVTASAGEKA